MCKKCFKAYDQNIINFISLTGENKNSDGNSYDDDYLQEPHDSDDDVTVNGDLISLNNRQNNHAFSNELDDFLGMCYPPDVEPDNISESNYHNYLTISVGEDKENIEISPTTNAADKNFEVRSETAYGDQKNELTISGSGLLCETTNMLVQKRHDFHGSNSENTHFPPIALS